MSIISIEKAFVEDAGALTQIMKNTFDNEAEKWLSDSNNITDYNIQSPGYSSIAMTKYMIEDLDAFKITYNKEIVGGIIATITGKSYGRIDRIFIHPKFQGEGIGSQVIPLLEKQFPSVITWDLETSSRQVSNHYFYEKMGYKIVYKTEDEYGYIKRIETLSLRENVVVNKDISTVQYEDCNMEKTECYQVNLSGTSFINSNIMNAFISNCNLSNSKYQNVNLRHSLFADLNLSNCKMKLVTLGGVSFVDSNLGDENQPISFLRCDLQGTKISNSNLNNLEIRDCDLSGMKIDGLTVEELLEAYYKMNPKE